MWGDRPSSGHYADYFEPLAFCCKSAIAPVLRSVIFWSLLLALLDDGTIYNKLMILRSEPLGERSVIMVRTLVLVSSF